MIKKHHPWGKIPVVTFPNGFALYESRAICKYLARKYSFPLLPPDSDLEATALFDQAQQVEIHYFSDPAGKVSFEKFVKPLLGLPPNEAAASEALRSVEAFFDIAEGLLQDKDYMGGKDFSLVDIFYIPVVQRLFVCGCGDVVLTRKAVSAWWDRCINRPTVQQILAINKDAAGAARQ